MSRNASPSTSTKCATGTAWALERERRPFTDPIEIPAASSGARDANHWEGEEEERGRRDNGEVAVVPPHVLLARRRAAFSMCSGQGRTLKGRDLRRVRDSVLRMTGFIES
ncbi:hypothetical protein PR202_gb04895 [Eleusine coracana subsp. coracana]|uniref:Senescence regulator n=1 Tax=Eleusine coracana subsp. coracana TaxID=191504 RepID=A0AAV5E5B3_ELECO|nr:hypothetical protein QOZ80_1BG0082030 [Eleusine coracana subsp. coracana]GJN17797.1 hypothetical protein PR202_gb04895 [Eleusine coracana subsp. coracana]